ncbi:MAG: hypothetical protein HKP06_01930 [Flavobacteriaceae bacterium]|nr:hypothetical protein [Flavobacteriaceae bacterium]
MAAFAMIIGHAVAKRKPYITKRIQPIELMILSLLTFFIKNEISIMAIAE